VTTPSGIPRDRLADLLADRALGVFDERDGLELEALLGELPDVDEFELDRTAAAIDLAFSGGRFEPMPEAIRSRIVSSAGLHVGADRPSAGRGAPAPLHPTPRRRIGYSGWWAAAACFVLAVAGWWPRLTTEIRPAAPTGDLRAEFLEEIPDAVRRDWKVLSGEAEGVTGEVIWSQSRQEGVMTFRGLPSNDPAREQYQLWILDEEQNHPIDGGVFDIDPRSGEAIVTMDPKIAVTHPTGFAVTVEKPGGVVVSDRKRLLLLAQI
jgi:hypothetical protein